MSKGAKEEVQKLLDAADIKINGTRAWDIQVHNEKLYNRVLAQGSLGLGESYMDGWWDVKELDQFFYRVLRARLDKKVITLKLVAHALKAWLINQQTKTRSKKVAEEHYDLGNDLYTLMLDKNMQYTCGYWKDAKDLDKAQRDKLDLICKKLGLKKGMTVLELGGGFGGLAYWMAKHYGCTVTSYNISKEQVAYGRKWCKGLPVTFVQADYRTAKGEFDRVVSIGMLEHVGYRNYRNFMKLTSECLKDDGLALFHTIGRNFSGKSTEPWISKYIFPNSMLPSIAQLSKAMEEIFIIEDLHNFSAHYDHTLMAWWKNFDKNWPKIEKRYGARFYRMWKYYLLSCAGLFRCRNAQLWQFVVSKKGVPGGYQRIA